MFHIFHFLQCDMVLGIVNPLSLIFHAISNEKSGLILRAVVSNFQLSSFGREKMKFLKLSQMNGLDK